MSGDTDVRPNIREALARFLDEQQTLLSPGTYRKYEEVVGSPGIPVDAHKMLGQGRPSV